MRIDIFKIMFMENKERSQNNYNYYSLVKITIEYALDLKKYLDYLFNEFITKLIKDISLYLPQLKQMQEKFKI